jgi:hypothetical protein
MRGLASRREPCRCAISCVVIGPRLRRRCSTVTQASCPLHAGSLLHRAMSQGHCDASRAFEQFERELLTHVRPRSAARDARPRTGTASAFALLLTMTQRARRAPGRARSGALQLRHAVALQRVQQLAAARTSCTSSALTRGSRVLQRSRATSTDDPDVDRSASGNPQRHSATGRAPQARAAAQRVSPGARQACA